ncbi:Conserved hypothetical protein [Prochlorococcus marinus str. MIT 9313]|uniref:Uncharacterized protein n=1 Tax=Prochlorococcus marinus (strain MIT 9313) TaxID=74547 RepID=B9ESN2_PROMM|nr:Conserved hypothetical protein [Prochlorococcus marinus str. MIT 9313]
MPLVVDAAKALEGAGSRSGRAKHFYLSWLKSL